MEGINIVVSGAKTNSVAASIINDILDNIAEFKSIAGISGAVQSVSDLVQQIVYTNSEIQKINDNEVKEELSIPASAMNDLIYPATETLKFLSNILEQYIRLETFTGK